MSIDFVGTTLKKHFSPNEYKSVTGRKKEMALHFLITCSQPFEAIQDWIQKCTQKNKNYLTATDTLTHVYFHENKARSELGPTGLTPLSLAVLTEQLPVVEALCAIPVDPSIVDHRGWDSLQHAIARGNPSILARIEEVYDRVMASQGNQIPAKEMHPSLREILTNRPKRGDEVVLRMINSKGEIENLTQRQFMQMNGGARFFDGIIGAPDALFQNWYTKDLGIHNFFCCFKECYGDYCKERPPLLLSNEGPAGLGVRVEKGVDEGKLVALFGAELEEPGFKGGGIESNILTHWRRIRSWASLVNDGFPNVVEAPIDHEVEMGGFVSLEPIGPMEQLLCDSDFAHPIKWGPRLELNLDRFKKVFPDTKALKKAWGALQAAAKQRIVSPTVAFLRKKTQFSYLFHTPSLLISSILMEQFDLDWIEQKFENEQFLILLEIRGGLGFGLQEIYKKVFQMVKAFRLHPFYEDTRKEIANRFLSNFRAAYGALDGLLKRPFENPTQFMEGFERLFQGAGAFYRRLENRKSEIAVDQILASLSEEDLDVIKAHTQLRSRVFIFPPPEEVKSEVPH